MGRFAVLILVLFIGIVAFFSISNTDVTTVVVPFGDTYEISKVSLMLISSGVGAFAILLIFFVRDTKRMLVTYQFQRKQKKDEKINSLYSRAMNAVLAHDEPVAKGLLEDILKEEPEHTDALLRLGDLASTHDRLDEAVRQYRKAFSSSPKNLEAMFSLADLADHRGDLNDAINLLEDVLEVDSDNITALQRKRSILERMGRWEDIVDVQRAIIKFQHAGHDMKEQEALLKGYRYEVARESLERGELEKAGKAMRNLTKEDESFVPAWLGVAGARLRDGDNEGAVSYLERGFEQTRSPIILARVEDVLIRMEEPSRLIRLYRKAVAEEPQNNMLRFFLGKLYLRLEMVDDALETLETGEIPEGWPEWYQILGELHMRRNQCEQAVENFRKTMNMRKTLRLPYRCGHCGQQTDEWGGRCSSCGEWNTYRFDLHGAS